jgi:hypothetical protein
MRARIEELTAAEPEYFKDGHSGPGSVFNAGVLRTLDFEACNFLDPRHMKKCDPDAESVAKVATGSGLTRFAGTCRTK